jgi:hypothetical protein
MEFLTCVPHGVGEDEAIPYPSAKHPLRGAEAVKGFRGINGASRYAVPSIYSTVP